MGSFLNMEGNQQDDEAAFVGHAGGGGTAQVEATTRAAKVASFFERDHEKEGAFFKCTITGCTMTVKCQLSSGSPGRLSHLCHHHPKEYSELPQPRKYKTAASQQAVPQGPVLTPTSQQDPVATQVGFKRPRLQETTPSRVQVVIDLICRRMLPFSFVEDPAIQLYIAKVPRNSVERLITQSAENLIKNFAAAVAHDRIAFTLDSGTNSKTRTVNSCVVHKGVSRCFDSSRLLTHDHKSLTLYLVEEAKAFASSRLVGVVTDNASNVIQAAEEVAEALGCISNTCACHCLNLFVKNVIYTWEIAEGGRKLLQLCRENQANVPDGKRVPQEIDTRWCSTFESLDAVLTNWHPWVTGKVITVPDVDKLKEFKAWVEPFFFASRECEKENATVFCALSAYCRCLPPIQNDADFTRTFNRNVFHDGVVCAAALHPDMLPSLIDNKADVNMLKTILQKAVLRLKLLPAAVSEEEGRLSLCNELTALFDGSFQSAFKVAAVARIQECDLVGKFWQEHADVFPILSSLFQDLLSIPASSASVERSFAAHSRLHTPIRNRLSEEAVSGQLACYSFLTAQPPQPTPTVARIDSAALSKFVQWCALAWNGTRLHLLSVGMRCVVYFKFGKGPHLHPYTCKLVEETAQKGLWKVKWLTGQGDQNFNAAVDPWHLPHEVI